MQNTAALPAEPMTVGGANPHFIQRDLATGWRVLAGSLLLGIATDVLFYRQALGLNAPLLAVLVLGVLVFIFARERGNARLVRRNLWLALPVLFFASMLFLRDEPFLSFLNLVAALLILGLMFFALGSNPIERLTVMAYPFATLVMGFLSWLSAIPLLGFVAARLQSGRDEWRGLSRVMLGLAIALPFLLLFAALFAAADAVFAQGLNTLLSIDLLKNIPDLIAQLILIGIVTWLCAGALILALERAGGGAGAQQLETPLAPGLRLGFIEGATVLASVNALFLVFVAIQFTYLFGGSANISVAGFTYAEYARRGFFELVAVAIVTMGLLLALDWLTRRDTTRQVASVKLLSLLLVALVLVILASAFQRMSLYEAAYGFTSLRVYTHWFMLWMGAVFVLKALAQWFERGQVFAFGGFLSLIVALAGFNLLNPDAFIAEQNMQRYLAIGKLDTDYAIAMSADAAPVIMAYFDRLQPAEREKIGGGMKAQKDDLYRALSGVPWQSYHLARKQALGALVARSAALDAFKPLRPRYRPVD